MGWLVEERVRKKEKGTYNEIRHSQEGIELQSSI